LLGNVISLNLDSGKKATLDSIFWQKMNEIFPYPAYRKEQFSIISAIQNESNKTLLIDAETGSGKTAAVLSAVLSRKQPGERIVIFTKMLSQMDAWFRELGLINDFNKKIGNPSYTMVPLVGKSHICPLVTRETKSQFSQLGCALFECTYNKAFHIIKSEESVEQFSAKIAIEIGKHIKTGVGLSEVLWTLENKIENFGCPYLALKCALNQADIVITTYPFLLEPTLQEMLFETMALDLRNATLIVDEAHNLAKGAVGSLTYRTVERAIAEIGQNEILNQLLDLRMEEGLHTLSFDEKILKDLENRGRQHLLWRFDNGHREISYALKVIEFLRRVNYCYLTAEKRFTLYLKDPRTILNSVKPSKQIILISGTFRPLNHFAEFLGVTNAHKVSVFSEKLGHNRLILTTSDPELTMKYKKRSRELFIKYSETIKQIADKIPGHTLVFTPNYEVSTVLSTLVNTKYFERPNQDVSKLISLVTSSKEKIILVAPARGKVSEGVEFVKNDRSLISSIIIAGLPYPPPSRSLKEIIKEYSKFWGEEKATNYMNYLQAAVTMRQCLGRMLRSENDVGAWIILDNRVNNMNIFPRSIECKNTDKMLERLIFFFSQHKMLTE